MTKPQNEAKQAKPSKAKQSTTSPCETFKFETHPGGVKIELFHFDWLKIFI